MCTSIKLNSLEDVKKLYNVALSYNGNMYISIGSDTSMLNAHSLLGMASLVGKDGLKLVFPDHADPSKVLKTIKKLEAALN